MISKDNPQQALLPNFGHEIRPFQHQNPPHQLGNFFLHQPPNHNVALIASSLPNPSPPLYEPTYNLAKKVDRNTKIKTANGVRDRRVRLSMGIARELFDLQEMLGFDRASKTIGWLLARSKGAIQELALEKQRHDLVSDPTESASASYKEGADNKAGVGASPADVVRENRVRARARARARTREKMSATIGKPARFDHRIHSDGMNAVMSQDSPRLVSCTSYLQDHPIEPISSLSGWNSFDFEHFGSP